MYSLTINRKQTLKQALKKLGYNQYINSDVEVPLVGDKKVEVELFTLGKYASQEEIKQEYQKRNLVADPLAIITLLIKHPKILLEEKRKIGIPLEGNDYMTFGLWDGGRCVSVDRFDDGWGDDCWFGGSRKFLDTKVLDTPVLESSDCKHCYQFLDYIGKKKDKGKFYCQHCLKIIEIKLK